MEHILYARHTPLNKADLFLPCRSLKASWEGRDKISKQNDRSAVNSALTSGRGKSDSWDGTDFSRGNRRDLSEKRGI